MRRTTRPKLREYVRLFLSKPSWGFHWLKESLNYRFEGREHSARFEEYAEFVHSAEEILLSVGGKEDDSTAKVLQELMRIQHDSQTPAERVVKTFAPGDIAQLCYCLVRLTRPSVTVETRVEKGNTSFYILKALESNGGGELFSIDFPLPGSENRVGGLVPSQLRNRWSLILGIGLREMAQLKRRIPEIDIFVHDSDHTYRNQISEYRFALSWLKRGGLLVSDDVSNNAFIEVCESSGLEPMVIRQYSYYVGIAVKR